MANEQSLLTVRFFRTANNHEPAREWLKSLLGEERKAIGEDIKTVQYGWPKGMPLVKKIEADLWEVRTSFPHGIARTFFTISGTTMVLLHGIVKKSDKTPLGDLDLARKRLSLLRGAE